MPQSSTAIESDVPWHYREHEFKPGDIVLCKASRFWLRIPLKWATGMEYVHGGIYVGDGLVIDTSVRYKNGASYDHLDDLIDPVPVPISIDDETRERIVAEAHKLVGSPFPGKLPMIVGIVCRLKGDMQKPYDQQPWWVRKMLGEGTLYCVQLPVLAYRRAGVDLIDDDRPEGLVLPRDIAAMVPGGLP